MKIKRVLALTLLFAACGEPSGPPAGGSNEKWPADGRTPALGTYDYTLTWTDSIAGSDTFKGSLTIKAASPNSLTVTWNVLSFDQATPVIWTGTSYETEVWHHAVRYRHRFWRSGGAERLSCAAVYEHESATGLTTFPATCSLVFKGN